MNGSMKCQTSVKDNHKYTGKDSNSSFAIELRFGYNFRWGRGYIIFVVSGICIYDVMMLCRKYSVLSILQQSPTLVTDVTIHLLNIPIPHITLP